MELSDQNYQTVKKTLTLIPIKHLKAIMGIEGFVLSQSQTGFET